MINLHMHTVRCGHAVGTDREYIEEAIKAGFQEIGFSDHAPVDLAAFGRGSFVLNKDSVKEYYETFRALREEYKDRVTIHLGYEMEYYPEHFDEIMEVLRENGCEYLLLGQHYTEDSAGHIYYSGNPKNDIAALDRYIDLCLSGMETGKFSYLAHPDLINFTGDQVLFEEKMTRFAEKLKEMKVVVEFNRLGFKEGRNYPNDMFWKIAAKLQLPTVIGIDAHDPLVYRDAECLERIKAHVADLGLHMVKPEIIELEH